MAIWYAIMKIEGKGTLVERSQKLRHKVEEPNLRQFDGEAGEEDKAGAALLFGNGGYFWLRKSTMVTYTTSGYAYILNLMPVEVRAICLQLSMVDLPKYTISCMTKDLMPVAKNIILHVGIPRSPCLFSEI